MQRMSRSPEKQSSSLHSKLMFANEVSQQSSPRIASHLPESCTASSHINAPNVSKQSSPPKSPSDQPGFVARKVKQTEELISEPATLRPGQRLSSSVMCKIIFTCPPPDSYVVDPFFIDMDFRSMDGRRIKRSLGKDVLRVVIPLHDRQNQHWTVVIFERKDSSAYHFDSSTISGTVTDTEAVRQCIEELDEQYVRGEIVVSKCLQQAHGFDCGIHVIANSVYQMTKTDIPADHGCEIWRSVCHALLSQDAVKMTQNSGRSRRRFG